jgi:hypothetical protein
VGALERDEFLRAAWRVMVTEQIETERLVFVDEMGTNTSFCLPCTLGHRKARGPTGLYLVTAELIPLCALEHERGRDGAIAYRGGFDHFRGLRSLCGASPGSSTLRRGQVVVMDNLSAHKGERIEEMIEGRGCQLLYLPSYSPDLNPIDEAFSKIKRLLRKAEASTKEALVEAIGLALSAVTSRDARGFFEHCGYRMPVQSLW